MSTFEQNFNVFNFIFFSFLVFFEIPKVYDILNKIQKKTFYCTTDRKFRRFRLFNLENLPQYNRDFG